jgi:hypothetical protein
VEKVRTVIAAFQGGFFCLSEGKLEVSRLADIGEEKYRVCGRRAPLV